MSLVNEHNKERGSGSSYSWPEAEKIFLAVVDAPADLREETLQRLTVKQPELKQEIQSLLEHDGHGGLPDVAEQRWALPLRHQMGESIVSRFRLLFPLSVTAHSEVWCGAAAESGRRVALKFLLDSTASRTQRFEAEANTLAKLQHPHIAPYIESGCQDSGESYIAMEYVDGLPITEYADRHELSISDRLQLMIRVCDAVIHAHRYLVVHRDLKPSNILVDGEGQPVVLDFGIAKLLGSDNETRQSLTATLDRPMTLAYASTEQVRAGTISTATDVHGLGLVLYELISGHHAYSDVAHPLVSDLFDRICESAPLAPSDVVTAETQPLAADDSVRQSARLTAALRGLSPESLRRTLRRGHDAVTLKALSKSPDERYRSVIDFRNDLQSLVEGRPIQAHLKRHSLGNFMRRRPLACVVGTATLAAIIVLAAVGWWAVQSVEESKRRAAESDASSAAKQAELNKSLKRFETAARESNVASRYVTNVLSGDSYSAEMPPGLPLDLRLSLGLHCAEIGQLGLATKLVEGAELVDASPFQSILAARVWQQLGRPTKGWEALHSVNIKDVSDTSLRSQAIVTSIRLLLDAQRYAAACEWEDQLVHVQPPALQTLLRAEMRLRIGWLEGARQDVAELQAPAAIETLSGAQLAHLEWLDGVILAYESDGGSLGVLEEIANASPTEWPRVLAQCRAWLELGAAHLRQQQTARAKEALARASRQIVLEGLDDHVLSLECIAQTAEWMALPSTPKDETLRRKLTATYWAHVRRLREFGTMTAARMASAQLGFGQEISDSLELLDELEPFRSQYAEDRYAERNLLWHQVKVLILAEDWIGVEPITNRLQATEVELWGQDTMESAFALAAQSLVAQRLGKIEVASALEENAWRVLREQQLPTDRELPLLLIRPATERWDSDKHIYHWIDLYLMQRENSDETLLEMLAYTVESSSRSGVETACEAAVKLSEAALGSPAWDQEAHPEYAERFRQVIAKRRK